MCRTNLSPGDVLRRPYPVDFISELLYRIHQATNVAGYIVEQVNLGHRAPWLPRELKLSRGQELAIVGERRRGGLVFVGQNCLYFSVFKPLGALISSTLSALLHTVKESLDKDVMYRRDSVTADKRMHDKKGRRHAARNSVAMAGQLTPPPSQG